MNKIEQVINIVEPIPVRHKITIFTGTSSRRANGKKDVVTPGTVTITMDGFGVCSESYQFSHPLKGRMVRIHSVAPTGDEEIARVATVMAQTWRKDVDHIFALDADDIRDQQERDGQRDKVLSIISALEKEGLL